MTTNATRLTYDLSRSILPEGLKTITVSIDGHDAETNDFIRGAGAFAKAVAGVRNLVAAKRDLGSRTTVAIKDTFRPTISPGEIAGFVTLGRNWRRQGQIQPDAPVGRSGGGSRADLQPDRLLRRVA